MAGDYISLTYFGSNTGYAKKLLPLGEPRLHDAPQHPRVGIHWRARQPVEPHDDLELARRGAGARFVTGHLVGDVVWATLALAAIIGVSEVGATVFHLLGLTCGAIGPTALGASSHTLGSTTTSLKSVFDVGGSDSGFVPWLCWSGAAAMVPGNIFSIF